MIQNILLLGIGIALGALIVGIIEANIKIKYIRQLYSAKLENSKILEKNKRLFDENCELKSDLENLTDVVVTMSAIMEEYEDSCGD